MSDEFRRAALGKLPPMAPTKAPWVYPPNPQDEADDDEEEELADALAELGHSSNSSKRNLTPLSASAFFDQALEVAPPTRDAVFRAYLTQPVPSTRLGTNPHGTYLVTHHGAGASGLSFAALARDIKARSNGELGVLTFDGRGHGKTRVLDGGSDTDLSLPTLVADLVGVIEHLFPDPKAAPSLVLLGHSMGAAPVLSAAPLLQAKGYTIPGVIVLDVVEGTAVEALPIMKTILSKRPSSFSSVSDAIQWHLHSGSIRNTESARVSVPSYIVPVDDNASGKQRWRTDLLATEPYWAEWYAGLSSRFLTARCARLLVLAGQERLDKDLMVGQMQGKFQLEVMQDVGHYLHEDDPASLASTIVTFWRRNTQILVLPPKIGSSTGPPVEVKHVGER